MDTPYDVKSVVRQKVPVLQGEVKDVQFDAAQKQFKYLVKFGEGETAGERWFFHNELEQAK